MPPTGRPPYMILQKRNEELARLLCEIVSWSEMPTEGACVHWYVKALRQRYNRAVGNRNESSL